MKMLNSSPQISAKMTIRNKQKSHKVKGNIKEQQKQRENNDILEAAKHMNVNQFSCPTNQAACRGNTHKKQTSFFSQNPEKYEIMRH